MLTGNSAGSGPKDATAKAPPPPVSSKAVTVAVTRRGCCPMVRDNWSSKAVQALVKPCIKGLPLADRETMTGPGYEQGGGAGCTGGGKNGRGRCNGEAVKTKRKRRGPQKPPAPCGPGDNPPPRPLPFNKPQQKIFIYT